MKDNKSSLEVRAENIRQGFALLCDLRDDGTFPVDLHDAEQDLIDRGIAALASSNLFPSEREAAAREWAHEQVSHNCEMLALAMQQE